MSEKRRVLNAVDEMRHSPAELPPLIDSPKQRRRSKRLLVPPKEVLVADGIGKERSTKKIRVRYMPKFICCAPGKGNVINERAYFIVRTEETLGCEMYAFAEVSMDAHTHTLTHTHSLRHSDTPSVHTHSERMY